MPKIHKSLNYNNNNSVEEKEDLLFYLKNYASKLCNHTGINCSEFLLAKPE